MVLGANFVSMILQSKGVMEFYYDLKIRRIPYKIDNLGGAPHIYFEDANGHNHSFHYNRPSGVWYYGCTRGPNWPFVFLQLLVINMNIAREKWETNNPGTHVKPGSPQWG